MNKQIVIDDDCRQFLMKTFDCSRMTVWRALNYKMESDLARRIRKLALLKGGELVGAYIPECECTFEEVEKTMTQRFSERVKLVVHRPTNKVTVWVDGKVERETTVKDIPEFMELQKDVELMATSL